jgi:hypothetical protein
MTRAQLLEMGVARRAVDASSDGPAGLSRVVRGLFLVGGTDGGWHDRVRRALTQAGADAIGARETAARLHGFAGAPAVATIQLAVSPGRRARDLVGIDIKRATLAADDVTIAQGIRVSSPLRTVVDCARYSDELTATCIIESACRAGSVTLPEVAARLEGLRRAPGVVAARFALSRADAMSESPLETALRFVLVDAGLPTPVLQLPFVCDGVSGRIDLAYPAAMIGGGGGYVGLAIEADGREAHTEPHAFERDRLRQTALEDAGWLVRRFTDRQVRSAPAYVVRAVRRAVGRVSGRG